MVHKKTQQGQGVLDLFPVIEPQRTDDLIGDSLFNKTGLQAARLGVGAVQNGRTGQVSVIQQPGTVFGLLVMVAQIGNFSFGPLSAAGPQGFTEALAVIVHYLRGNRQDPLGRAVVLLQLYDGGIFELIGKGDDVTYFCSPEAINRLIVIAHYT